jgi:serine/threonine-protein kinase
LQQKYDAEIREKEIEILKKDKKIQRLLFAAGFLFIFIILALIIKKYIYLFAFWKRKNYIGHYRVMEKIASGGMGTIYKVHEIQDKTKEFAVKVLRDEYFSDESYKKMFKNEAVVIDQFNHPNIVKVIERGETEDNIYIAMELLDGKTLSEILEEEERLDIPIALSIMIQTVDALCMIHKKKITHRDLKPENIMIIKTEENPYFVKVLDFGLAKQQTLTRMTQTGIIMGSIFYLSPEHITNSPITTASDIYALGVIFYQVISGEMLFFGDTAVDIAQQILEKEPIALNKLRKDVPEELNRLITKMMNKEPGKRPSAEEILDILKK